MVQMNEKEEVRRKEFKMGSTSSPQILPVSSQTASSGAKNVPSAPPIANPAFRSFVTNLSDYLRNGFSQRRPWSELWDRSALSQPVSVSEAALRLRKNYTYFRVNYSIAVTVVVAFFLLSHPFCLLLLLALLGSWLFLYLFRPSDTPVVLFGRSYNDRETLGILVASTVFVVFLTSVGSLLISAVMVGLALVAAHGSFRVPEDLFLDEQEPSPAPGFFSFLGGAATHAAAVAAPSVSVRV